MAKALAPLNVPYLPKSIVISYMNDLNKPKFFIYDQIIKKRWPTELNNLLTCPDNPVKYSMKEIFNFMENKKRISDRLFEFMCSVLSMITRGEIDKDETIGNYGVTVLAKSSFFNYLLPFQKMLLAVGCDVNKARTDGVTPLYIASQEGHINVVDLLIRSDADVNKARNTGTTPLIIASQEGHINVVELLIRSDADVNKARNDGATALHSACYCGHINVVRKLIDEGADVNAISMEKGNEGVNAMEYAKRSESPTKQLVIDYLNNYLRGSKGKNLKNIIKKGE